MRRFPTHIHFIREVALRKIAGEHERTKNEIYKRFPVKLDKKRQKQCKDFESNEFFKKGMSSEANVRKVEKLLSRALCDIFSANLNGKSNTMAFLLEQEGIMLSPHEFKELVNSNRTIEVEDLSDWARLVCEYLKSAGLEVKIEPVACVGSDSAVIVKVSW
ncbi:MAG: hypothetical protein HQ536_00195 [Parcubacteria group bacterium]|nr:hypothetical protein [Parcubacteria group bacterium]